MENSDATIAGIIGTAVTLVFVFQDSLLQASEAFGQFMVAFGTTWGYLGAFLISIVGNFTVIFPVPYSAAIFLLGAFGLHPLLLGVSAGMGAGLGEVTAYLLGRGVSETSIKKNYEARLASMQNLVQRYGFWVILVFAATPLPDDLLMIPIGMIKYDYRKAFVACFIGKIALCTALAYAGYLGLGWLVGGSENVWTLILGVAGVILASYLTIRVDWVSLIDKTQDPELIQSFWGLVTKPVRIIYNHVQEYPVPSAMMTAFIMISISLLIGNLVIEIAVVAASMVFIIASIFYELKKNYQALNH